MTTSITSNTQNPLATALNNSSTKETQAATPLKTAASTDIKADNNEKNSDSVNFSQRAVKIQSIANEFFSDGGLSMADIPNYVQRLQSDGFLTQQQAEKLGVAENTKIDAAEQAKQQVVNFIEDFKSNVSETEGNDNLIAILNKSKTMVESLGQMNSTITNTEFKRADIELKRYLESDQAKQWSDEDISSLKQVSELLSVATELNYGTESSKAANRYAQFSGR